MSAFDYSHLRTVLLCLPLPTLDPPTLDFRSYVPSKDGLEKTESINGAVNDDLEKLLGYKVQGITLCEGGPGVTALADVLERYVKLFPDDAVLALWGPAVLAAAENAYITAGRAFPSNASSTNTPPPTSPIRSISRSPPSSPIRHKVTVEEVVDVDAAPLKQPPTKKQKTQHNVTVSSVPPWIDLQEPHPSTGRPPDLLAHRLSVLCYDSRDASKSPRLRCLGSTSGCPFCWVAPRNKSRVYKHASTCTFIPPELRQQASIALSKRAPSALAEEFDPVQASPNTSSSNATSSTPSVLSLVTSSGRQNLKALVDFDVVRFICAVGLPPTCVDRPEFKTMLGHLNNRYTPVSSSTISNNQIPAEAARVLEKTIAFLRTQSNLTLSLDGGQTRRPRSVYTFHVATPERRIFLMRGEDTSSFSHTGEHVATIARQVMDQVGCHRFSAVVTDGASNVVCACKLLVEETPTVINLTDPCHKLSLLIKDISKIDDFTEMISQLRRTLNHFSKSTYATAVLTERRQLLGIGRGLETIGKTQFGTIPQAASSMLRCMPPIRQLVAESAITIPGVGDIFQPQSPASMRFEMQLTVYTALLNPILRALTCLESSFSTPADVLLLTSAALAAVNNHLEGSSHGLSSKLVISDIRRLASKRFSELINESPTDIYVAAFYLDPYFRNTRLLRNINPLSIKITLNASDQFSSHAPQLFQRAGSALRVAHRVSYALAHRRSTRHLSELRLIN